MKKTSFTATEQECLDLIQRLNTELGYPRTYTQEDLDNGTVTRVGGGIHVPIELITTETIAQVQDDDPENPSDTKVVHLPQVLNATCEDIVVEHKVLRILNHSTKDDLVALPGIGSVRADAIIALREVEPIKKLDDAKLSASVLDGIKEEQKLSQEPVLSVNK